MNKFTLSSEPEDSNDDHEIVYYEGRLSLNDGEFCCSIDGFENVSGCGVTADDAMESLQKQINDLFEDAFAESGAGLSLMPEPQKGDLSRVSETRRMVLVVEVSMTPEACIQLMEDILESAKASLKEGDELGSIAFIAMLHGVVDHILNSAMPGAIMEMLDRGINGLFDKENGEQESMN